MVQRDLRQPLSCKYFNDTARRSLYKLHLNSVSQGYFHCQIGPKLTRKTRAWCKLQHVYITVSRIFSYWVTAPYSVTAKSRSTFQMFPEATASSCLAFEFACAAEDRHLGLVVLSTLEPESLVSLSIAEISAGDGTWMCSWSACSQIFPGSWHDKCAGPWHPSLEATSQGTFWPYWIPAAWCLTACCVF